MNKVLSELLLLPVAALEVACNKLALPLGSKAEMAQRIAAAGTTAADVRKLAGMAAPVAAVDPMLVQRVQDAAVQAAQAVGTANAAITNAQKLAVMVDKLDKATTSVLDGYTGLAEKVAAAGAVAARAEAAALAVKPAKVNADAVKTAIADAVAQHIKPLGELLAQASPEVQAEAAAIVAAPARREPTGKVFGIHLTDRKGNPIMVDCWDDASAPPVDPVYIWTETLLRHFVAAQEEGENVWLSGPKGTGKTQAAQQFAARTGRSFTRVNFQKFTAPEDYVGAVGLESGATVFKPGDFLLAYRRPGAVILLDEISNADAGNLAVLNGYLEPAARVNAGGKFWTRAAGVLVFAADNSQGNGDDSGRYAGLRQMNSSLLDRFARMLTLEYLPADQEAAALVKHTGCSKKLAAHVITCINAARAKVTTGDIIDAPSLRQCIAFVKALRWLTVDEAWHSTVATKQPAESAAALEAVKAACLNRQIIEGEL